MTGEDLEAAAHDGSGAGGLAAGAGGRGVVSGRHRLSSIVDIRGLTFSRRSANKQVRSVVLTAGTVYRVSM